ncbi:MAG: TolC family protein [Porphyromonadaceae bacterium]|nr:TolC family protein [Porphyromonadaceae bacterium]
MKKILFTLLSLCILIPAQAQNEIEKILQDVEANNTTLQALQKQIDVQKLGNKTGIWLPDPEITFEHLWGTPREIGNQNDFGITQSFDFPTVYGHRNKLAGMENQNLDRLYQSERINILLRAKQIIIKLIYNNALSKDYAQRVENDQIIVDSYQKKFNLGEADAIERNKVYLTLIACANKKEKIDIEREALLNELKSLNGGKKIQYDETNIPLTPLPSNFDEWYATAESKSPALQYLSKKVDISKQQVKVSRAQALPKLSAGYYSERILGEKLQGATIGISIPLWENRNTVKQAKAGILSSESALEDNRNQFYNRLQNLFNQSTGLRDTAQKYRAALSSYSNEPLLKKALDAGEISLLDYLLELEFYYDAFNNMLEAERDYALAVAELTAVEL